MGGWGTSPPGPHALPGADFFWAWLINHSSKINRFTLCQIFCNQCESESKTSAKAISSLH
jgi:hypothetical protein